VDVTRDDKEIAAALRGALARRLGSERAELWFGAASLRVDEGVLVVEAATPFALERLRRRLVGEIEAACRETDGAPQSVAFRVAEPAGGAAADARPAPGDGASSPSAAGEIAAKHGSRQPCSREHEPPRRPLERLESFVVGPENRVAHAAAAMATERPGSASPLVMYGPNGTGKTHLLEGIAGAARRERRRRSVVYLTAEQFTTLFLEALRGQGLPSFRRKHRGVDLLLIDDVQFFAGKRATINEVVHTIDSLRREGTQLVLSSDRPPTDLAELGPELTTRLSGGLVCGLEPPLFATRLGIARQLAARHDVTVPEDVLEFIAAHLPGDARRLAGAIMRVKAASLAHGEPISLAFAEQELADLVRAGGRMLQLADVDRAVCDVFGLAPRILQSEGKSRGLSRARMLAMWLARKYTRAALAEIGRYFGRRSHATVISARKQVVRWLAGEEQVDIDRRVCSAAEAIRRIEARLRTA
jgi:chromosomal replication initiator protein